MLVWQIRFIPILLDLTLDISGVSNGVWYRYPHNLAKISTTDFKKGSKHKILEAIHVYVVRDFRLFGIVSRFFSAQATEFEAVNLLIMQISANQTRRKITSDWHGVFCKDKGRCNESVISPSIIFFFLWYPGLDSQLHNWLPREQSLNIVKLRRLNCFWTSSSV